MFEWLDNLYYNQFGRVIGRVIKEDNMYVAMEYEFEPIRLGYYISEEAAKKVIENSFKPKSGDEYEPF